jgi:hypothetical protein
MTWALIYLTVISIAEMFTATLTEVRYGIILHSVILVMMILQGATTPQINQRRFLLILSLAPLIRILSISLPLGKIDNLIYWYLIIGSLLYVGALYTARISGFSARRMGFTLEGLPLQFGISLIGFGLGLIEYLILRPKPLLPEWSWGEFLFAAIVLMIFTGLLEEFIFRSLLQEAAITTMGSWGILYGAIVFAVLHFGYRSWFDVVFVFLVGGMFGIIFQRTRSIVGVTLAHGFTNIGLYLIFPFIITSIPQQDMVRGLIEAPTPIVNAMPGIIAPISAGGGHFPGRYVTSTPAISPTPSPSAIPSLDATLVPIATITPAPINPITATTIACTAPPADWVIYIVQTGDTLSSIAQLRGTTVARLQSVNCLQSTVIVSGQRLSVPNASLPPTQIIPITDTAAPTQEETSPTAEPSTATLEPTEPPTATLELPSATPVPPTSEPPAPEPTVTP